MVQLEDSPNDLGIAVVFALPKFVIEHNYICWLHAFRYIKGLNTATEHRRYAEKTRCIAGDVCRTYIFRKVIVCRCESSKIEPNDAVDAISFAQAVKLR